MGGRHLSKFRIIIILTHIVYVLLSKITYLYNIKISVADQDPYVLGLLDPDPDLLVRCMDQDPDPFIVKQK
jgi:hypothetical protein